MQAVSIGPLVFSGDRLAAIVGIGAFTAVTLILSSRLDPRIGRWSTWALIAGLITARLGHVIENAASFAAEPWRILAVWQGGFSWPWAAVSLCCRVRGPGAHAPHGRWCRGQSGHGAVCVERCVAAD
jgi:prolipoprotein diacylglyceryltransferase